MECMYTASANRAQTRFLKRKVNLQKSENRTGACNRLNSGAREAVSGTLSLEKQLRTTLCTRACPSAKETLSYTGLVSTWQKGTLDGVYVYKSLFFSFLCFMILVCSKDSPKPV